MSTCNTDVTLIKSDEYIGDSLSTINQNFENLQNSVCDLSKKVDKQVNIRTFFYYGPNTPSDPQDGTAGMDNNNISRPSDITIQNFVNSPDLLNLKPISKTGDITYVIYQKTGWYTPPVTYYAREGTGQLPFRKLVTYTYYVIAGGGGGGGSKRKIGIAGKCWVAREAYNGYSPKWQIFKDWLFDSNQGPTWLQNTYLKYGERFANWLSTKTSLKKFFVKLFDLVVKKANLNQAFFVSTPSGPIRAENIKKGDVVYGYDHITGELKECRVANVTSINNVRAVKIYHETGELILPSNQKIYVQDGTTGEGAQYIEVKKLKKNDFIHLENNEKSKVLNIECFTLETPIQKFEIEDKHNYVLNNVCVHNGYVVTVTVIVTYYVGYGWSTTIEDTYKQYEPIFVLYKLKFNGYEYIMESGWPKYSRASTESTTNWNNPQEWLTY